VRSVFGDLGDDPAFVDAVALALRRLERDGVRATLAAALDPAAGVRHDAVTSVEHARRTRAGVLTPVPVAAAAAGERLLRA
jgi:fructuronate reductase/mannitol 2-dehydrogenase